MLVCEVINELAKFSSNELDLFIINLTLSYFEDDMVKARPMVNFVSIGLGY